MDEERLYVLEQNLKDRSEAVVESEKRYDEVLRCYICVATSNYPSVSCLIANVLFSLFKHLLMLILFNILKYFFVHPVVYGSVGF